MAQMNGLPNPKTNTSYQKKRSEKLIVYSLIVHFWEYTSHILSCVETILPGQSGRFCSFIAYSHSTRPWLLQPRIEVGEELQNDACHAGASSSFSAWCPKIDVTQNFPGRLLNLSFCQDLGYSDLRSKVQSHGLAYSRRTGYLGCKFHIEKSSACQESLGALQVSC